MQSKGIKCNVHQEQSTTALVLNGTILFIETVPTLHPRIRPFSELEQRGQELQLLQVLLQYFWQPFLQQYGAVLHRHAVLPLSALMLESGSVFQLSMLGCYFSEEQTLLLLLPPGEAVCVLKTGLISYSSHPTHLQPH